MRLLIVEDDPELGQFLVRAMRAEGDVVDHVMTGEDGLSWPNPASIDLIILDKHLPDMDALAFIKAWRSSGLSTPILVLSADGDCDGKVNCLNAGADDYVLKPFRTPELIARCRVLNRRQGMSLKASVLEAGDLKVDTDNRRVELQGLEVILSAFEYRLLEFLMRRNGRPASKSEIIDVLYPSGEEPQENAIEAHVSRLRRKIGTDRIISRRGIGYALVA